MDLKKRIEATEAVAGVIGLGYVGLPLAVELARNNVPHHRLRRRRSQGERAGRRTQLHPRRAFRARGRGGEHRACSRRPPIRRRWPRPTSSTSACRRRCARPRIPDLSYVVKAVETTAAVLRQGPAHHPGVHHLSRAPPTRSSSPRSRPRASRRAWTSTWRSRPSASIPGNPTYQTKNIPKVVGGYRRGQHRGRAAVLPAGGGHGGAGELHARRRDGEAAREHVPRRQHRHGERAGADVPPHGHRRVGGDRRGEDQAVRLHAVLSRPRPGRPLHPDRSVLPVLEGEAVQLRGALHRARRPGERLDAGARRRRAWPRP